MDNTSKGQGWCPPCEIYLKRESFFITYVRSLTYIGITLNRLKLEERKEDIKKNIHMHHEYKVSILDTSPSNIQMFLSRNAIIFMCYTQLDSQQVQWRIPFHLSNQ